MNEKKKKKTRIYENKMIVLKCGVVSQANGSALIEIGSTKVLCSVHGPRSISHKDDFSENAILSCHVKFATFATVGDSNQPVQYTQVCVFY